MYVVPKAADTQNIWDFCSGLQDGTLLPADNKTQLSRGKEK